VELIRSAEAVGEPNGDDRYIAYVTAKGGWLRRTAYLLCQDWDRADDLVQTAITRLYAHWRRAERVENLDGYVHTVLMRAFFAEQRTVWWRRVDVAPWAPERAAMPDNTDVELDLRVALRGLPPGQRATVVLRFYCDLSVEQTAEVLGCSTGNVKSQTARGVAALRRVLDTDLARDEELDVEKESAR
jgi:RNA polymerase sigma-70 factor (sigma-E family)